MNQAAQLLRDGGLVAFPTETVYGLGANALDATAVGRIFAAKERPSYNPLIVHVPDADAARSVVAEWPALAERAAAAFWPGPLTLVLPRQPAIPDIVTAGLETVAVRVPAHPVALALLRAAGVPIAAPSANRFTRVSPTTAAHVAAGLGDRADLIIDGGATPYGIESTVLDVTGTRPRLLRYGAILPHELAAVLGPIDEVSLAGSPAADATPLPSPGMADRHYSPAGQVMVYTQMAEAEELAHRGTDVGQRVGAVVRTAAPPAHEIIALPDDARGYARLFYAALHTLDDAGCDLILLEAPPQDPAWAAIRDRMKRAGALLQQ